MIDKIIKIWTKYGLILQQKKNISSLETLENYLTNSILKGDQLKKSQLIDVQNKLNESIRFLKFLTNK